jgi:hypothetical protein
MSEILKDSISSQYSEGDKQTLDLYEFKADDDL